MFFTRLCRTKCLDLCFLCESVGTSYCCCRWVFFTCHQVISGWLTSPCPFSLMSSTRLRKRQVSILKVIGLIRLWTKLLISHTGGTALGDRRVGPSQQISQTRTISGFHPAVPQGAVTQLDLTRLHHLNRKPWLAVQRVVLSRISITPYPLALAWR